MERERKGAILWAKLRLVNTTPNTNLIARRTVASTWLAVLFVILTESWSSSAQPSLSLTPDPPDETPLQSPGSESIWEHGVGEGFRCGAQSLTLSAGATYGFTTFGGKESHDLALCSLTYGVMLDNTVNKGHWYRGNIELRGQLFGGEQFSPRNEWLVGLTPHIRYNFATGSRWIPYIDGGAGVTLTSIREPDLGGVFQFNLQAAVGVERFLTDKVALTVQAGYLHMSSADIYTPNLGLNCVTGMAGVSFFF